MTSTSELPSDPPVSMPSDDDQAKAGSNTTLPMEYDTDPGTSPSRPELVFLHYDSSSSVKKLQNACVYLVTSLKFDRNTPHENRKNGKKPRLWQKPPKGWPEGEPFWSPNNGDRANGKKKPVQKELLAMYKTLKSLYYKKYPDDIPTKQYQGGMPDVSQPQRSVTGSSTCEHLETASGGDAVNKRQQQGTQPEESNMSTLCQQPWSDLGIKHLGLGSFTGNEGVMIAAGTCVPMVVKEGPGPGSGPQLQGVESEVTEDEVLEELERYDDRESTPANFISDVVRYFTTELKPVVGVGARMPNHDTGQAGHAPVQYQCSDTSNQCEHPTVSTKLRTDIRPNGTLTDSASNADECPQQENGPKTPGNQMQLIFCEEPSDHHVQNKSGKRKRTSVVESEPGPPLPKRLCPGTNGKFTESLHVPPRLQK